MESLGKTCTPLKNDYEHCFNQWYSEHFLKGDLQPSQKCQELFDDYRACLAVALKQKGVKDLLDEARKQDAQQQHENDK